MLRYLELHPILRNSIVAPRQVSAVLALYCSSRVFSIETLHHLTTLITSNKNRASLASRKCCYTQYPPISKVNSRLQHINYCIHNADILLGACSGDGRMDRTSVVAQVSLYLL
jgi:hypothetical protein